MVARIDTAAVWDQFLVTRSAELREQLVLQSVSLVHFLLGRLGMTTDMGSDYEDLVHQGLLGLIDAVDRFDPHQGASFSTYASMRIRGKILDYLRASDWMSRSARQRVRSIQKAISNLWLELGREPEEEEIASSLGISAAEVQAGLRDSDRIMLSLDSVVEVDQDGEGSLYECVRDEKQADPADLLLEEDQKEHLISALKKLSEREQQILALYYYENLTLKDIGKVLGITESRVSQLHSRAIMNLKAVLSHD